MQDYCFHIHTPRCGHADANLWEADIARLFYEAGFKTIAFTDHNPWKTFLDKYPHHAMRWDQMYEYIDSIHNLAKEYEGKMKILTGFECEYIPELSEEMAEIKRNSEIVVSGQHFTRSSNGEYISMHKRGFVPNSYELDFYAKCLVHVCETKFANILAHPDLYMIHKTEFGKKEEETAHKICQAAEKYNVPVEINLCMASKKYLNMPDEITYPHGGFWNIAKEYNLTTVVGLDFHGYTNPNKFEEIEKLAFDVIGEDILSKLHICTTAPDLR